MLKHLLPLVDSLDLDLPLPTDNRKGKKIPLNEANFAKKEFQALWNQINHKAVYQVGFDSAELIRKCITAIDDHLNVAAMQYVVQAGTQVTRSTPRTSRQDEGLASQARPLTLRPLQPDRRLSTTCSAKSPRKLNLLGVQLPQILRGINPATFAKFRLNPEQFITEAARIVNEQKATAIIEHLTYDALDDRFDTAIFTESQTAQDFANAGDKLKKHIYDYVVTDSKVERKFVNALDTSNEVAVYAKLPRGFFIPTPVGDYSPDWAIAFTEGAVKHIYFVAETKGSLSSLQLKGVEGED